jgi:hypothetical protein
MDHELRKRSISNLGPVKALSKADRLRYHQHSPQLFVGLFGGISTFGSKRGVTLLPYLVQTQPRQGRPFDPARGRCRNGK